jgi:hypothetical protein
VFGLKKRVVPMFYSSSAELDMGTARNAVWFLGKGDQDWDQIYPMTSSARSQPNARRAASR